MMRRVPTPARASSPTSADPVAPQPTTATRAAPSFVGRLRRSRETKSAGSNVRDISGCATLRQLCVSCAKEVTSASLEPFIISGWAEARTLWRSSVATAAAFRTTDGCAHPIEIKESLTPRTPLPKRYATFLTAVLMLCAVACRQPCRAGAPRELKPLEANLQPDKADSRIVLMSSQSRPVLGFRIRRKDGSND